MLKESPREMSGSALRPAREGASPGLALLLLPARGTVRGDVRGSDGEGLDKDVLLDLLPGEDLVSHLGAGLSKVAGKLFRIGHIGDLNELMLLGAIAGAEMAMLDMGVKIEPGSGVAAAQSYWRKQQSKPAAAKAGKAA